MREVTHRLAFLGILVWGAACGGSTHDKQDGGADAPRPGLGGRISTGGTTGTSARGGNVGSGGRATGGAAGGGAIGSGGASSVGGAGGAVGSGGATRIDGGVGTGGLPGSGGRASGGATGVGGGMGGAGGSDAGSADGAIDRTDSRADARPDASPDRMADGTADGGADAAADLPLAPDSAPEDGAGSGTLESCFVGLPAQVGAQMIATKSTADGRVRMRIALDTEDRGGTSGTMPWGLIRLAVEVDGAVTCITDRSFLLYGGSHHNCDDTATATAGTIKYSITAPDRSTATLTIETAGVTAGPYILSDTACTMSWSAGAPITCRSGGPC